MKRKCQTFNHKRDDIYLSLLRETLTDIAALTKHRMPLSMYNRRVISKLEKYNFKH